MKRINSLLHTRSHTSGLVLRLTLALAIFPHGCQMLLGWFGGYGFEGSMNYLTTVEGLPWALALAVILLQFAGPLLMAIGFGARFIALSYLIMFAGMIITSHLDHGFFMNWSGQQQGEGFEYHILAIGLSLALLIKGAGRYSVDHLLSKNSLAAA